MSCFVNCASSCLANGVGMLYQGMNYAAKGLNFAAAPVINNVGKGIATVSDSDSYRLEAQTIQLMCSLPAFHFGSESLVKGVKGIKEQAPGNIGKSIKDTLFGASMIALGGVQIAGAVSTPGILSSFASLSTYAIQGVGSALSAIPEKGCQRIAAAGMCVVGVIAWEKTSFKWYDAKTRQFDGQTIKKDLIKLTVAVTATAIGVLQFCNAGLPS